MTEKKETKYVESVKVEISIKALDLEKTDYKKAIEAANELLGKLGQNPIKAALESSRDEYNLSFVVSKAEADGFDW